MKTLLVEDDPTTRYLLESILKGRGYEVTSVGDAETAWPLCQQSAYPLIMLDWLLPGMDGLELCRKLRRLPHGDRSLVVVLTSRDQPADLQAVLEAGADDYLTKPVDVARLTVRLAIAEKQAGNLLQRKQAEAQVAAMLEHVQRTRDDLLSILNELRVGSAMTDAEGRITFLSQTCQPLLGCDPRLLIGKHWQTVWAFEPHERAQLEAQLAQPPARRSKVAAHLPTSGGRHYWVDVEVKDDPRAAERKIFFLYDMSEVHDLRRLLDEEAQFQDLIGKSEPMVRIYEQIRDVARVDSTVLIEGETGTGKELVARAIHFSSRRKHKPFIALNCAGLTDSLLGSQLFGHRRGAFTGAVQDHKGLFEAADGGTLFLDEVGDIPANVQTSLLRVLQEREVVRLGDSKPLKVDVRVLAATHHNLADDVARGTFRSDLLYRIRVVRIHLPPLQQRREDIPLLVSHFLGQCGAAAGKRVEGISKDAMRILLSYRWPGNVRELKSAVEFAIVRSKGHVIEAGDLPAEIVAGNPPPAALEAEGADERQRLLAALKAARGNRVAAARLLGISRATLYRRLAELNTPGK
ncbi:MAG TPA: sigma 54-interacting transcriptional regulator [Candidatus Margulisiibacteriota bacterium]|nr:sigma 54-interacting transcriptional regulator [Candidatus Margulisiibacteriota bacterium]